MTGHALLTRKWYVNIRVNDDRVNTYKIQAGDARQAIDLAANEHCVGLSVRAQVAFNNVEEVGLWTTQTG